MRKHYLDNIRWSVVLLVVIYHVFYIYNACGILGGIGSFSEVQYQDALLYFVYPWFMVLLFAVAGMSARYALEKKPAGKFIGERTVKLLIPSTLGLFVFHWVVGYLNVLAGGGLKDGGLDAVPGPVLYLIFALSGSGPLWFAQLLWLYSLPLALIRKLDKNDKLYTLCGRTPLIVILLLWLPLWGAAQIGNMPVITVYRLGIYFAAFLMGYFFLSHEPVPEKLGRYCIPLLAAALMTGVFYVIYYFGRDYTAGACLQGPFTNFYAWLMTLALIGCYKAWFDRTSPFADYMAKSSFGIYVLHYFYTLLACIILKDYTPLPAVAAYPLAAVSGICGSVLCNELFRRIPFIRFFVLGIRKPGKRR